MSCNEPRRELSGIVGHPVTLFAYPDGVFGPGVYARLRRAGYAAAFQLADRLDRRDPLWSIRRIIVPEMSGADLVRSVREDF